MTLYVDGPRPSIHPVPRAGATLCFFTEGGREVRFVVDFEPGVPHLRLRNTGDVPLVGPEGAARPGEDLLTVLEGHVGAAELSLCFRRAA